MDNDSVLAYLRENEKYKMLVVQNLSSKAQTVSLKEFGNTAFDLLHEKEVGLSELILKPFAYHWLKID